MTLAAVHACAHLQAQLVLLPSRGTQLHAHAYVLYPVLIVQIPTTLTLAAVHACAPHQDQHALLPSRGTQLHAHAYVLYPVQNEQIPTT